jgi:hypothetical protein
MEAFSRIIDSFGDNQAGKASLIEWRNHQGKTPLYLALENQKFELALHILEKFDTLDLLKKDSLNGNTYLHLACQHS